MRRIVIITGLSGSGKTTAKDAFEDMGYYCVDNLPVSLLHEFLALSERSFEDILKMALVMDARAHDFISLFPDVYKNLKKSGYQVDLLFLEASDEKLGRRFSETRRKHPLSMDSSASQGIEKERKLLKEIRSQATRIIDTTDFNVHQLKELLYKAFGKSTSSKGMNIKVTSFGYRFGLPIDADIVLDVRFLPNPYFKDELKGKTGNEQEVAEYIMETKEGKRFMDKMKDLLKFIVPLYEQEWKAYLNISIGCTGGRHRSVAVANEVVDFLGSIGKEASVVHRDIDKS